MSYPVVVLNLANRIYLHQPFVLTSIGEYENYVLKDSISAESTDTDIRLEDGQSQLGSKER